MDTNKAKTHARRLEAFLKSQGVELPYSACLEAIAHVEGVANWQTLEAQSPAIAVHTEHLSGMPAASFFELPFMHPNTEWPLIDTVLVADSLEEEKTARTYRELHMVNEEAFEILAKEARGETLTADDRDYLKCGADEEIVLDWGDEYEGEGLTLGELRGITQFADGVWKLKDGRKLELFARGKVIVPLTKQKGGRKRKAA